jgi:hypothetical protein
MQKAIPSLSPFLAFFMGYWKVLPHSRVSARHEMA